MPFEFHIVLSLTVFSSLHFACDTPVTAIITFMRFQIYVYRGICSSLFYIIAKTFKLHFDHYAGDDDDFFD